MYCAFESLNRFPKWSWRNRTMTAGTPPTFDLEMRVATYASRVIGVCDALPTKTGAAHIRDQLFRSSTSVAANYAEASVPESRKDFIHKMNIALKELVETRMWLRIIIMRQYIADKSFASLLCEPTNSSRFFIQA